MADRKKRIMRAFRIDEISGVDSPAQKGATAVIMKRDGAEGVEKRAALTKPTRGHSHVVEFEYDCAGGRVRSSGMTSYNEDHAHPWIVNADGEIVIGEAMGHTHEVDEVGVAAWQAAALIDAAATKRDDGSKEVPMADDKNTHKTDAEAALAKVAALEAELAVAKAVGELTDAEKAHYGKLDDAGKKEFLAKSKEDRAKILADIEKAAKEEDPVVYKSDTGEEFRKSDDPRLITMAKRADEDRRDLIKARVAAENAEFAKRAETELSHFPGTVEVRTAIVKAVAGIEDEEVRKEAEAALKAQNAKLAPAFKTVGAGGSPAIAKGDKESAEAELDTLAKKAVAEDTTGKLDYYTAYEKVSKENPELLKRAVAG